MGTGTEYDSREKDRFDHPEVPSAALPVAQHVAMVHGDGQRIQYRASPEIEADRRTGYQQSASVVEADRQPRASVIDPEPTSADNYLTDQIPGPTKSDSQPVYGMTASGELISPPSSPPPMRPVAYAKPECTPKCAAVSVFS